MNKELIQKFLNKACYDGQDQYELEDWLNVEKFTELIVRECAELAKIKAFIIMQKAEEYAADKEEMINATSAAFHLEILEQEIRKHFGVEE
jgi:tRNA U54 and U55 pseudouridine synthase Pus10